ncbi:MAG: SpoIIE family protein phosphatase, partial [Acidobacteria bacterium]|nr:SpoIIE family protein phosphatase [Acidobacteriota bacterium]NIQ87000.1 SpoIIE family protein phosphatase [Acidobacteriota bacterium]
MKPRVHGLTDVGRRRENNQDQLLVDEQRDVYAVADGMGGHAAGEVASNIAIQALAETIDKEPEAEADRFLVEAFQEGNRRICESVLARGEWRGMGTTIVALVRRDDKVTIGHVGDSRSYVLRDGNLLQLTDDHSWVGEQVRMGLLTDEEAQKHPMRNIVTRAMGNRLELEVDVLEQAIEPGDVYLLCSDGLNSMIGDDQIGQILS